MRTSAESLYYKITWRIIVFLKMQVIITVTHKIHKETIGLQESMSCLFKIFLMGLDITIKTNINDI